MVADPVAAAVERGVDALLDRRDGGWWRGFPTLAGTSDHWVSGFVAAHLATLDFTPAGLAPALGEVRARLREARRPGGGWGYGGAVPEDADSTAWCLMALAGDRGFDGREREEALAALRRHGRPEGFVTYRPESGIHRFIGAADPEEVKGWTSPHPDVTVAALLAEALPPGGTEESALLRRLCARQSGAGWFEAYWWRGTLYTTALLQRLLARRGRRLLRRQQRVLLAALVREELPDGGYGLGASMTPAPFATALGLETICRLAGLGGVRLRRRAAAALLAAQRDDGTWSGDHVLRIPAPAVVDPARVTRWVRDSGGGNSFVDDRGGLFATALACFALDLYRAVEADDEEAAEGRSAGVRPWRPSEGEAEVRLSVS